MRGRKRSTSSSWKLESSQTIQLGGCGSSTSSLSAVPTLPAVRAPRIAPSSSVVVVLPFVPVIPMIGFGSSREAELDLAPDRQPALACGSDERRLARDAGALDEDVHAVQELEVGVVPEGTVGGDDVHAPRFERRLRRPA